MIADFHDITQSYFTPLKYIQNTHDAQIQRINNVVTKKIYFIILPKNLVELAVGVGTKELEGKNLLLEDGAGLLRDLDGLELNLDGHLVILLASKPASVLLAILVVKAGASTAIEDVDVGSSEVVNLGLGSSGAEEGSSNGGGTSANEDIAAASSAHLQACASS
jgi:hypothetical protein